MSTAALPHDVLAAPITGVRRSRLRVDRNGQLRFGGLSFGGWESADAEATCAARRDHEAPAADCTCGFWVCRDVEGLQGAIGDIAAGNVVEVTVWGRVVEHVDGWRAERLRVDAVIVEGPDCGCGAPADRVAVGDGAAVARCGRCAPDALTCAELELFHGIAFRIEELPVFPEPPEPEVATVAPEAWSASDKLMIPLLLVATAGSCYVMGMAAAGLVVGGEAWDGLVYSAPRPHMWWAAIPATGVISFVVGFADFSGILEWSRSGRRRVYAASAAFAIIPILAATFTAPRLWSAAPSAEHAIEVLTEEHDLVAADLGGGRFELTPRQGEPCTASLRENGPRLELHGNCVERVLEADTGGG